MKIDDTPNALHPVLSPEVAACLIDRAPFGILICEGSDVVWANQTLLEQIDSDREELRAAGGAAVEGPAGRLAGLFGGSARIRMTHRDGHICWLERVAIDLADAARTVWFFRNVTREAELENSLEHFQRQAASLEIHDPETGLLNRHGVIAALDRQLARSRRYGNALAVIRLTLEAPHHPGDESEVLCELSQEFRARLRWADEMGRLDRNSFLLVLPETTRESARMLTAKMRDEGVMPSRRSEGWVLIAEEATWQKGDDRRRLLRRVGVDA